MPVIYPVKINSFGEMETLLQKIGADKRSLEFFERKRNLVKLYVHDIDFRAASFLKQEMLARGGDVAVHRNVIDGKTERSDVLILGRTGELRNLLLKLRAMDCWGIKELREDIERAVKAIDMKNWVYEMPRGRKLEFGPRTLVMGILNLTPDSFHADSRVRGEAELISRARAMLNDGADILDIGAESTRPSAERITTEEEKTRLMPPLIALRREFPDAVISVDTMKPDIASLAAEAGVDIINDVGSDSGMAGAAAKYKLPLIITHNKTILDGSDITEEILTELGKRINDARDAGVNDIIIDPGVGFGKRGQNSVEAIKHVDSLIVFGMPILVGHSRKQFFDGICGTSLPEERLYGTIAISSLLAGKVQILRVHDVKENVLAIKTAEAIRCEK